jgi:hypothetical protein
MIIEGLEDIAVVPVVKDQKWKLTFDLFREPDEEEKEAGLPAEGCRVQVELFKVKNENTCIEFSRKAGSVWYFYEQFKMLKEKFSEINDAVQV